MHLDLVPPQVTQIPPWKLELLSRRSALSRTVEPKLNGVRLNPVPEQSASSESNVKAPPKCFTSWKELKDGAGIAHTFSINNSQRPLSSEARRSHHPQVAVTCATLFNGDGAFKSSSNRSGEPVVVEEEGGASKRSSPAAASTSTRPTSTGAPLSPVSSLDWSQSAGSPAAAAALSVAAGWPAHRPSRCSSLDFRTSSAVNPTQPFNRDQATALAHHKNQAQIAKVAQIEIDPGNALLAKRNLDDPGSPAPTDHRRPSFVTKGHLRPAAGKLKMGEDNASAAFVEKAQDQAAASSCGGASSDEIGLDSDSSSDELHYGPGFVSRLKSRYMSAALRSSTTANAGGLRRTASLEDFLDKDKEEVSIELINVHQPKVTSPQQGQGRYQRKDERTSRRTAAGSGANSVVGVASQVNRKARESIKRCQSVEVLARNKLEDSKPPPLPPKSTPTSTSASTVESVLNSEALSNDKIQLTEKSATTSSSVPPPPGKTASTLTEREKKKLQQPATVASEASSTVIASLRRPFHGRRRSAGLLFGVEEKELPKTGVVDSTRKIFESRPSAGGGLGLSSAASATGLQSRLLIKSRSTSSLYGRKSPSSSPVRRTLRQQSTDNNQQAPVSSSKKKDLNSLQSSTKPRTASPAKTSKSLVNSSSSKPALPAKPELKTTSSKNKYHNTTSNSGAEATNVTTSSKSRNKNKFEVPPLRHIDKNHRQDSWNKTTPVSSKTNGSNNNNGTAIDIEEGIKIVSKDSIDKIRQASGESFNFNFKKKQPAMATKPYLPLKQQAPAPPPPQQPPATTQPVPPTPPPKIDTIDTSGLRDPPATPVPVGIIKPISRPVKDEPIHNKKQQQVEVLQQKSRQNEAATESATAAVPPIPPPTINKQTTKPRAESPTTTLNNLINLTKQNNATNNTKNLNSSSNVNKLESSSTHGLKKEVILIDKKPLPTKPPPPKKQDSVIPQPPQPLEPILKVQSSQPRPPAVFANSNKIVTFAEDIIEAAEEERLDDHSAGNLHSEVDRNGAKENNSDEGIDYMDDDMDSNMKSNYRDSWKKRQEAETKNTMVFNFLNSQKDVTHIENDGLDLSKRKKKQHLRQLAKVSAPEQHNFS